MRENKPEQIIIEAIEKQEFLQAVFSDPLVKDNSKARKIEIRPVLIKEKLHYQITEHIGQKTFHRNCSEEKCQSLIFDQLLNQFKQALISLKTEDYQILTNKKGMRTYLKKATSIKNLPILSHNRKKNYILKEGTPIPFLVELGVMTKTGQIIAKKQDKFRQLNRFLEMIEDILPSLNKNKRLHIIDFGCGKSYLTFALYYFLHEMRNFDLKITGLDLKEDVVNHCQMIAKKLKFEGLNFCVGDINHYITEDSVDMMVTLHACDTATDAALEKAVEWKADVILSVPCCQHELFNQVENDLLNPLLKHGILKERFSSLITDAARVQILEIMGYQTQILEFIDMEHTPKNLLIRAVKNPKNSNRNKLISDYKQFKKELKIEPSLEKRLYKYF